MAKKMIIATFTSLVILTFIFSFTYVFAADGAKDMVNGVRNIVGGAEDKVEKAVKDVSNLTKNATGDVEKAGNDITEDMSNGKDMNNGDRNEDNAGMMSMETQNNGSSYTASRTATETPRFMGMTSTAWTWLIIGIAALVIVGLVWYYSMQMTGNNYDDGND